MISEALQPSYMTEIRPDLEIFPFSVLLKHISFDVLSFRGRDQILVISTKTFQFVPTEASGSCTTATFQIQTGGGISLAQLMIPELTVFHGERVLVISFQSPSWR